MSTNVQGLRHFSTAATTYLAGVFGGYLNDFAASFLRFARKYIPESRPTCISYRLSHVVILDHTIDIEILNSDQVVVLDERQRNFMSVVLALVCSIFISTLQLADSFISAVATFLSSVKLSVQPFDLSFRLSKYTTP